MSDTLPTHLVTVWISLFATGIETFDRAMEDAPKPPYSGRDIDHPENITAFFEFGDDYTQDEARDEAIRLITFHVSCLVAVGGQPPFEWQVTAARARPI